MISYIPDFEFHMIGNEKAADKFYQGECNTVMNGQKGALLAFTNPGFE